MKPTTNTEPVELICKLCTIRLEALCFQRCWWFRGFRLILAGGVWVFAFFSRIEPQKYVTRSPGCHHCLRFQKNALKEQSALFRWLDSYLNPFFNRLRDRLLTPEEIAQARSLAAEASNVRAVTLSPLDNRRRN
jgi:hypothetical protein